MIRRVRTTGLFTGLLALAGGLLGGASEAAASGPVERIVQVMPRPGKPDSLVLRYGLAAHGFLYSSDAGKTFRATCSTAVAPELAGTFDRVNKISLRQIASTAAVAMDGAGHVMFSQYGSLYESDATGCAWARVKDFDERWAYSIKADPADPSVVWAAVSTTTGEGADMKTTADLMRRDATGKWSLVGPVLKLGSSEIVYDGELGVYTKDGKTRLYLHVSVGGLAGYAHHVLMSDDGGKTWKDRRLPVALDGINLLAVDPTNPDRLLAAIPRDGEADRLLISSDQGATFKDYLTGLRAISGVTFDPTGRVFVSDAGDATSADAMGGLFTAPRLGEPLKKIESTESIDCVHHDAGSGKLYVCQAERFGVANPLTGAVQELVRMSTVPALLECPGRDLVAECQNQLNEGPAWCCAGHYPFTPLCGQYDITRTPEGRRVFCGKSGREYDTPPPDAGMSSQPTLGLTQRASDESELPDAPGGAVTAAGCSVRAGERSSALGGLLAGLSGLLVAVRRTRRRR